MLWVDGILPSRHSPTRLLTERHPDSGLDLDETDRDRLKDLVSEWDEKHFTYEVSVRYYLAVVEAIRAVDPHHLVLGSRLHGAAKSNKSLICPLKHVEIAKNDKYAFRLSDVIAAQHTST